MLDSLLILLLSYRAVLKEKLVPVWFSFTVVSFLISWRNHDAISLLLQNQLLFLLIGALFLLLLLKLWSFWFPLVQTGVPVLVPELISGNLLSITVILLWEVWINEENKKKATID